ncbi:3-phenylpropionate/cinnamic acid dioxygenase subunit beta [Gordonia McavH-238-E]|uniref:3-phenylpropionate/cinnamic acid dioxygenase subunit beta n=1 Tax=Gordonia sp. McavH-238-E TaxID=2917736 RepID=UPI001EF524B9|nr:3-phenylpropionate/cinnamic acid dioxygenase subunit beta [Gordonia sp. McavH-238-E]MCG7632912.1 3-phenylpropionate/cinnamic acid dioxygenase subunit beta [Gordonia sp. McavH-238-E]
MIPQTATERVTLEVHHEISQFLFREARLLDDRLFDEWLGLLAEDIRYVAPVRLARMPREQRKEFEPEGGGAHFDDTKEDLAQRVRKVNSGRAWSEVPASRTRHLITNVEVEPGDEPDSYRVMSNFFLYRTRSATYQDQFAGGRRDLIRRRSGDHGDLELARRTILLDQTVLLGNNLSVFL